MNSSNNKSALGRTMLSFLIVCLFFASCFCTVFAQEEDMGINVPLETQMDSNADQVAAAEQAEAPKTQAANTPKKATDWKLIVGSWSESDCDPKKAGDFTFIYTILAYKKLALRMDTYTGQTEANRRYWIHYGAMNVYKSPDLKIGVSPGGMMLTTKKPTEYFYGGTVNFDFPKIGLNIEQRSYAGTKKDLHYTFSNLKLHKNFLIQNVYWTYGKQIPRSYLGPKVAFKSGNADFSAFYGWSVVHQRPDANFLNLQGSIRF